MESLNTVSRHPSIGNKSEQLQNKKINSVNRNDLLQEQIMRICQFRPNVEQNETQQPIKAKENLNKQQEKQQLQKQDLQLQKIPIIELSESDVEEVTEFQISKLPQKRKPNRPQKEIYEKDSTKKQKSTSEEQKEAQPLISCPFIPIQFCKVNNWADEIQQFCDKNNYYLPEETEEDSETEDETENEGEDQLESKDKNKEKQNADILQKFNQRQESAQNQSSQTNSQILKPQKGQAHSLIQDMLARFQTYGQLRHISQIGKKYASDDENDLYYDLNDDFINDEGEDGESKHHQGINESEISIEEWQRAYDAGFYAQYPDKTRKQHLQLPTLYQNKWKKGKSYQNQKGENFQKIKVLNKGSVQNIIDEIVQIYKENFKEQKFRIITEVVKNLVKLGYMIEKNQKDESQKQQMRISIDTQIRQNLLKNLKTPMQIKEGIIIKAIDKCLLKNQKDNTLRKKYEKKKNIELLENQKEREKLCQELAERINFKQITKKQICELYKEIKSIKTKNFAQNCKSNFIDLENPQNNNNALLQTNGDQPKRLNAQNQNGTSSNENNQHLNNNIKNQNFSLIKKESQLKRFPVCSGDFDDIPEYHQEDFQYQSNSSQNQSGKHNKIHQQKNSLQSRIAT